MPLLNSFFQLLESHKTAELLVPRMNFITSNEFTVKDTFLFCKRNSQAK